MSQPALPHKININITFGSESLILVEIGFELVGLAFRNCCIARKNGLVTIKSRDRCSMKSQKLRGVIMDSMPLVFVVVFVVLIVIVLQTSSSAYGVLSPEEEDCDEESDVPLIVANQDDTLLQKVR